MFETQKIDYLMVENSISENINDIEETTIEQNIKSNNSWIDLCKKLGITGIIIILILIFILGINVSHDINMAPSIGDGDLLITYKLDKNMYSDLVVSYKAEDKTRFGRIIGVPGDVIFINTEGNYTINNNIPSEKIFYNTYPSQTNSIAYPYEVPKDCYFILNDYRNDTKDSREFGAIHKKDIKGQMLLQLRRRGF